LFAIYAFEKKGLIAISKVSCRIIKCPVHERESTCGERRRIANLMVSYRRMSESLRRLTSSKTASRVSVLSKEIGELALCLTTSWATCFESICDDISCALEKVKSDDVEGRCTDVRLLGSMHVAEVVQVLPDPSVAAMLYQPIGSGSLH
jgi:hypothetical protein